ncbi:MITOCHONDRIAL GROUP I INTRON SPLICING FACTOR CCM1 [Salix purpurea]|uniref:MITOCHONDRIAL GROUP I INTRON SPLICING FACTOR CCM1 n=1 Tax=Salix purpurea TaxID=77065 RepID=A0A9Q1AFN7_SALPP|nr:MITOCHONDRIAL GROUP I INTRON SPLICING FACTOR CCM1 [Salix purpurea]
MSSLCRHLHRTLSTTTSATAIDSTKAKSFCKEIFKERNLEQLVEKFKIASVDEDFRTKPSVYKEAVRRLAAARKLNYVEEILEDQKQYKDISKEGFNAHLISLYGSAGMFDNARKVFDEMLERDCARTVLSFNALLGACVKSKKFDEAEGLFKVLSKELEIEPDLVSYNTVLKAFCEMGSLDSAVTLLDEMEKKGLEPDLITFNTLLNGFYAKGRFVDGERIWEQMKEKNVEPDVRSYNAKLLGLALERRMEDAVKAVEEMKRRSGCKLDRLTLECLIPFALQKGDFMFAYGICKCVLCSKLPVQNVLIQSVVDALAEKSKIEAATELVKLGDAHHAYSLEIK